MKTPHKAFSRRCTAAANAKESEDGHPHQEEASSSRMRTAKFKIVGMATRVHHRERVRKSREHAKGSSVRERQRISVHPAVLDEPKDHDVTKGRDESLRCEGGHSTDGTTANELVARRMK